MENTRPTNSDVRNCALISAFPAVLGPEVALVADLIHPSTASHQGSQVLVQGELINIPYRVHHEHGDAMDLRFDGALATINACIMTRHHDGYLRQRYVRHLVASPEPWVIPFVFHLCGEYVAEILCEIEASLPSMDQSAYAAFFRENPTFFKRAHDRMISYWDCYYRGGSPQKLDYVGFRVFNQFRRWCAVSR